MPKAPQSKDGRYLVIVESPTKAKTIRKFLPKNYMIEASIGHIRDLPQSAADIPAAVKKEEWSKIGVNVEKDFEPLYVVPKGKSKIISELKSKMKEATSLYLATDEDREGESISWHLTEVLKPKIPVKRMVFHEITQTAIRKALEECRDIDFRLVRAQETRRILDRLVGYTVSPLIWKKIAYGLSAGRVQSSALRMIVDRERERMIFVRATYWDLLAALKYKGEVFEARMISLDGKRLATSKDFDETTGKIIAGKDVFLLGGTEAEKLQKTLQDKNTAWTVETVEEKPFSSRPSAPFITSTLQQEANRKLGMSSRETMRAAQNLYEEGWITYMRTDSPALSQEAVRAARKWVSERFGNEYLPDAPRSYVSKDKAAQEAHEAIRPAGSEFTAPDRTGLSGRLKDLYELIWMRTIASQMVDAQKKTISAKIKAGNTVFQSNGTLILFPGFLRAYVEGSDDPKEALANQETILPPLKSGDSLALHELKPEDHETQPPGRFSEASIVRELEKNGIGRPSTYASIISTLLDREYTRKIGNALVPTFTGIAVTQLLEKHFSQLVDANFTSEMENVLDEIAEGKKEWLPYLREFYSGKAGLRKQVNDKEDKIDADESRSVNLPNLKGVEVRIGRYGAYVVQPSKGKEDIHATIPEDVSPADLTADKVQEIIELAAKGPQSIGKDPETGLNIYCLSGRFGPYVQLGEVTEEQPKPRRASIPKGVDPRQLPLDQALKYLSLPKTLGTHPETGQPVLTNNGRFGPYVQTGNEFRSLKKTDDVYTVDLKRALELLSEPRAGRGAQKILKELGNHPEDGKPVQILEGKYGPYLKHKRVMASIPKEKKPEEVTLPEALALLEARASQKKRK